MNAAEIEAGNTFALTDRINSLASTINWQCIEGERNGVRFVHMAKTRVCDSWIGRAITISPAHQQGLVIRIHLRLPKPMETAFALFLIVEASLIALIVLAARGHQKTLLAGEISLGQLASQVAHDIRAPLAAISGIIQRTERADQFNELTRQDLRQAAKRISDIANNLLTSHRTKSITSTRVFAPAPLSQEPRTLEFLQELIETTAQEKREQLRATHSSTGPQIEVQVEIQTFGIFAEIQPTEFCRLLSNLLNNSAEACAVDGRITLRLKRADENADSGRVLLSIEDNGKGMTAELLSKVVNHGGSFGKTGGNGLGLSHAKAVIESWGGSFQIDSTPGKGTRVQILLSSATPPSWFSDQITLSRDATIVVLDDDPAIHDLWVKRFEQFNTKTGQPLSIVHFRSSTQILEWYRANVGTMSSCLYLCDFDLGKQSQTGLEIIQMLGISAESILVTHHTDDEQLREQCEKHRIKMLPKRLAGSVPIVTSEQQ